MAAPPNSCDDGPMSDSLNSAVIAEKILEDPRLVEWKLFDWEDVLLSGDGSTLPGLWLEQEDSEWPQGPLRWDWILRASSAKHAERNTEAARPGQGQREAAQAALKPYMAGLTTPLASIDGGLPLLEDFTAAIETWTANRLQPQPARRGPSGLPGRGSEAATLLARSVPVRVFWPVWRTPKLRRKAELPDVPLTPRLLTLLCDALYECADWSSRNSDEYRRQLRGLLTGKEEPPDPAIEHASAAFDFTHGLAALGAELSRAPDIHVGLEVDELVDELVECLADIYAAQIAPLRRASRRGSSAVLFAALGVLLGGKDHLLGVPSTNAYYTAGRIMECLGEWKRGGAQSDEEEMRLYRRVEKIWRRRSSSIIEQEPRTLTPDQEERWGSDRRWARFCAELDDSTPAEWWAFVEMAESKGGSGGVSDSVVCSLFLTRRRISDPGWLFGCHVIEPRRCPLEMRRVGLDRLVVLECQEGRQALDLAMERMKTFVGSTDASNDVPAT